MPEPKRRLQASPEPSSRQRADDEDAAERQVADEVEPVRMKGEGSDETPPLAVEDFGGVGVADGDPVDRVMPEQRGVELGQVVEGGQEDE